MNVTLFYLSDNTTGGWVTYTAHLSYGLVGLDNITVRVIKVRSRSENRPRPFGYDLYYENTDLTGALTYLKNGPGLVVALQKNHRQTAAALVEAGAWVVVHDPAEFKNLELKPSGRYVTIRRVVTGLVPGAVFVPHPYRRHYLPNTKATGEWRACSTARIDFDKNTIILLDANRLLPKRLRIHIHGFENRLYTKFKVCPYYPEWVQSVSHYPRNRTAAAEICHRATYSVDMSLIKGDGGGTQYSFLEAMDAGSVPVIHSSWIRPNDEMVPFPLRGFNCFTARDGRSLAAVVSGTPLLKSVGAAVNSGGRLLTRHDPMSVATQLIDLFKGG